MIFSNEQTRVCTFLLFVSVYKSIKGRTQCRRLPTLCGSGEGLFLSPKPYPQNVQRLGLEPGTFQLQTVGSTTTQYITTNEI